MQFQEHDYQLRRGNSTVNTLGYDVVIEHYLMRNHLVLHDGNNSVVIGDIMFEPNIQRHSRLLGGETHLVVKTQKARGIMITHMRILP